VSKPVQVELSTLAYLRLVVLGAVIGIPAALVASVFLAFVHELEHWLWHDLPSALGESSPPWYLVIGLPVVGACLVVVARRFLPGDGGHEPLHGFGGKPPLLSYAPGVALAAIGTLAFGAVLGPEGPLIALGAVVGIAVTRLARLGAQESAVLGSAGSFSAVSSLFGGPVIGGVLMMEGAIGFGASAIPILLPGFVAAGIGYLVFIGLGDWGGLHAQAITVTGLPPYTGAHLGDLSVALAVGVLCALVVVAVRRLAYPLADSRSRLGMPLLLVLGGLAVGLLAQTAAWLGADSQDVLFSGQASVPAVVAQQSTTIVLILIVAKALAYAVSLGSGFRGGPVFPGIFLGVALATLPVIWFGVSPTLAVAVGAAAGMAAVTRMLLTPILFAALLVGPTGVDAVPAAVLAAAAAWLVMAALERRRKAQEAGTPEPAPSLDVPEVRGSENAARG
jgi:H+/Cl- antiporter ClcA